MFYFIASIGLIGGLFSIFWAIPAFVLARYFPKLKIQGQKAVVKGTSLLMSCQPWYRAQLDFKKSLITRPGKVLFVANHRSHLDVFVFLTQIPGIRIFANKYIFKVPFLGIMMRLTEQIPVEQNKMDSFVRGIETLKEIIESGGRALIFPELTRCPPGHKGTLRFSSAPFRAALDTKAIVIPIVIRDTDQVWPRGKMEIHWGVTVNFKMLEPISSTNFASADDLAAHVRNVIDLELGERPVHPLRPREVMI